MVTKAVAMPSPNRNKVTKLVHSSTKTMMEELHHRQEKIADTVASVVDEYWKRLAAAIADNAPPDQLIVASKLAHSQMAKDIRKVFEKEIEGLLGYTNQRAVANVLNALPDDWIDALLQKAMPKNAKTLMAKSASQKKSILTPVFSTHQVSPGQIVKELISDTTHLGDPLKIASTINTLRLQGKTSQSIARAIKPQVYGVKSTVRRVVRDSSQFAASAENLGTWNAINTQGGGEFIIGYEVHAVPRTKYSRPEHLARSGTIYYFHPKAGQKGLDQMPQPPYDRENGRLVLKHNCRCFISPRFADRYQPVKKVA